ncbi:SpoIIIAC/SpoIIIAD family protein [Ruminococcus sp. FC2018]|uniref:SpoIIIAC/SpoIIIAD family protein n=1 Tax=Ruminococcus sp. FC2018 TaxID=1410617 RepID=UPI0004906664|nr:SpoIIIAC/SpoIIIAD family protein [Ruminococcus sp. FC2018]
MNILTVCGFCIVSVIACKSIESDSRQLKLLLTLIVCVMILLSSADLISRLVSTVKTLFDSSGIDNTYIKVLFKSLGVVYLTQFTTDYCRDCGENAVASQVMLAGKIALLIISLPLFNAFVDMVKGLLL